MNSKQTDFGSAARTAAATTSTATAAKGLKYFLEEQRRLYHLSNLSWEKQWLVLNVLLVKESKMMTVYA